MNLIHADQFTASESPDRVSGAYFSCLSIAAVQLQGPTGSSRIE